MKLVEQIRVPPSAELKSLCRAANALYNEANFQFRQFFFLLGEVKTYYDLDFILKGYPCYRALPAQTNQQVLRQVVQDWQNFFASCKAKRDSPAKFRGPVRPPGYKPRGGQCVATFTNQNTRLKGGWIHFPKRCGIPPVRTRVPAYQQVRVVPRGRCYVLEVVHEREAEDLGLDKARVVGIDVGLNNLVTAANNAGLRPFIIRGGVAKSVNQFYNKVNARLQSKKDKNGLSFYTKNQQQLNEWRKRKLRDFFHKASRHVVNYCVAHDIGRIIIGQNKGWKQNLALGRRNNQNFAQVPLAQLVQMITYKAALAGIDITLVSEPYTSQASALDGDEIAKGHCTGRRLRQARKGGKTCRCNLYKRANGEYVHGDVNGAANIIRKAVPDAFAGGIKGIGLCPALVAIA